MEKPFQVFCCYAPEDQPYLLLLKKHLKPLERDGLITVQADIDISPGEEWEKKISHYLNTAQIILLLISPDFMNSEYSYSKEMMQALQRHECGETHVIPIILRPIHWHKAPFAKLQVLPTNAAPVISRDGPMPDDAFLDVAKGIHKVAEELLLRSQTEVLVAQRIHKPLGETLDHSIPPTGDVAEQSQHQTVGKKSIYTLAEERSYRSSESPPKNSQSFPLTYLAAPPSAQEKKEKRDRQSLLKKIQARVTEEIRSSLYNEVLRELRLSTIPEEVAHPWHFIFHPSSHDAYELPSGTTIIDVYDRTQGVLLILGEGGTGKTTLLLQLALDLLHRAEQDETHPLPIVLNVSTWAKKKRTLDQWLAEVLARKPYRFRPEIVQSLIKKDLLLPLLDGFDQITEAERSACARVMNNYQKEHSLIPLVVCSRDETYLKQKGNEFLDATVTIQPLTPQQVNAYLWNVDRESAFLQDAFSKDPLLYELAKTPLILCILTLSYRYGTTLNSATGGNDRRKQLFTLYTKHMLKRKDISHSYSSVQTIRGMNFLARHMTKNNETEFYIEYMEAQRSLLFLSSASDSVKMCFSFTELALTGGITGYWFFRVIDQILKAYVKTYSIADSNTIIEIVKSLPELYFSSPFILLLIFHLFFLFVLSWKKFIAPVRMTWPLQISGWIFILKLLDAIFLGFVLGYFKGPSIGLAAGLLVLTMLLRWPIPIPLDKDILIRPNQGIYYSLRQGVYYGLGAGSFIGSLTGWIVWQEKGPSLGISIGFSVGLLVLWLIGLPYGGKTYIQHFYLRLHLIRYLPLNISHFLRYAETCLLLRRIGGGYSFFHPLFQDYFATLGDPPPVPPLASKEDIEVITSPSKKRKATTRIASASLRRRKRRIAHLRKPF